MPLDIDSLPPRARAWNRALAARPGDLDLHVPASQIRGVIPAGLRGGRLLSNGPGWNVFGDRVCHPFDGHGYLRRFSLNPDGSVDLRARFIRTEVFVDEERAGGFVHRGFATNGHDLFWKNLGGGTPRNVANTTIYPWGGRLLAGWEAGSPYAVDPETLDTIGPETFGGLIDGEATLAHMGRDGDRLILCGVKAGRTTRYTFRELGPGDALLQTRTGEVPGIAFAHDFAFTDRWYVLGGNPLSVKPWGMAKALLGAGTMLTAVSTNLGKPGELVLVPRDADGPTRHVTLPAPSFVVHFVNAHERGDDVIVDVCVFHDFTFGEEFGYAGPKAPFDPSLPESRGTQSLYRVTIPAGSDEATWEQLVPHGVDFPRIRPGRDGQEITMMVGATRADTRYSDPFDSVIRVDLANRAEPSIWTAGQDVFVGEPLIAPSDDGEHVLALLSDGTADETTLVILDAEDLASGPVAEVPLPLLPVAFHGDWIAPLLACLLLAWTLAPSAALACATCGSPAIPGLAAKDQWGAYPMPAERSGPLLRLEGADERVLRIAPVEPLDLRGPSLELFVPGDPLAPRTVAAGFTLRHAAVGLHVCGPEVSLKVALP